MVKYQQGDEMSLCSSEKSIKEFEGERRSTLTIKVDILGVAINGARITKVVYNTNTNFKIARKYLDELIDSGHIEEDSGIFCTTKTGCNIVKYFKKLSRVLEGKLTPVECPKGRGEIVFLPSFFYLTKNWPCASFVV